MQKTIEKIVAYHELTPKKLGLLSRLETTAKKRVPAGKTLLVSVTAPIHLAGKTAAAIEEKTTTSSPVSAPANRRA